MSIRTVVALNGKVLTSRPRNKCRDLTYFFTSGFTAIVDKQLSKKYETLVNNAPELIKVLPWGKDFEVDVFRKPDFTALEVLSFATGGKPLCATWQVIVHSFLFKGIPAGINVSSSVIICS